jgi:hypothetical protein
VTPEQTSYPKPGRSVNVLRAQASPLGGAYMDWSPMPIVTAEQNAPGSSADIVGEQAPGGGALVMFRDPRFMGGIDWLHLGGRTPLTGIVTLDAQGRLVNESMDGRAER